MSEAVRWLEERWEGWWASHGRVRTEVVHGTLMRVHLLHPVAVGATDPEDYWVHAMIQLRSLTLDEGGEERGGAPRTWPSGDAARWPVPRPGFDLDGDP